jgi:ketosteroid isomerase-like protein
MTTETINTDEFVKELMAAISIEFELPTIMMCEIKDGKHVRIREYIDLQNLTEDTPHHLYSDFLNL